MYIQKIKIKNFKSIVDLEIDFEDVRGLWKLDGKIGAGKTSVGEALIFALYGSVRGKNNPDLIRWGESKGEIEIFLQSNNHNIHIIRELTIYDSKLLVYEDGEIMTFTNKRGAQTTLETEYYDTSRMMIELLCIISFNNFRSLATLNATDSKKFLDQVFGFYVLTEYINICKELRSGNQGNLKIEEQKKQNIQSQITKIEELNNRVEIKGDLKETEDKISELKLTISQLNDQYNKSLKKFNSNKLELSNKLAEITTTGKLLAKDIKLMKQKECPVCGGPIDSSKLLEKIDEKEKLGEEYKLYSENIKLVEEKIVALDEFKHKKESETRTQLQDLQTLATKLTNQNRITKVNKEEVTNLENDILTLDKMIERLEIEDLEWVELYEVLSGSVRSFIISSFIPSLNSAISVYSQQLSLPYDVIFDNEFKCSIKTHIQENIIPISSLSTGQLKVVDIAIILGTLKTIMSSVDFNICFLDELVSNMDTNMRGIICEVLKNNLSHNQTIFLISHTELDDTYFDGEVGVKMIDGKSNYIFTNL